MEFNLQASSMNTESYREGYMRMHQRFCLLGSNIAIIIKEVEIHADFTLVAQASIISHFHRENCVYVVESNLPTFKC